MTWRRKNLVVDGLEVRVPYPPWLRHSLDNARSGLGGAGERHKEGFFSPKDEAYHPLGQLVSIPPLVAAITHHFPHDQSTPRGGVSRRNPANSHLLELKPETGLGPRGPIPAHRRLPCSDPSGQLVKSEVKRSQFRLVEARSGASLLKLFQDRVDVRGQVEGLRDRGDRDRRAAEKLLELKRERTRSLADKLSFYDESRMGYIARSRQRREETRHLPWEQACTTSLPQTPEKDCRLEAFTRRAAGPKKKTISRHPTRPKIDLSYLHDPDMLSPAAQRILISIIADEGVSIAPTPGEIEAIVVANTRRKARMQTRLKGSSLEDQKMKAIAEMMAGEKRKGVLRPLVDAYFSASPPRR